MSEEVLEDSEIFGREKRGGGITRCFEQSWRLPGGGGLERGPEAQTVKNRPAEQEIWV